MHLPFRSQPAQASCRGRRDLRRGLRLLAVAAFAAVAAPARADPHPAAGAPADAAGDPRQVEVLTTHAPDGFYDIPQTGLDKAGALLRSEPLTDRSLPSGVRAWRIQYATAIDDRTPAAAVAVVFAAAEPKPGPRPVILWAHGTTGLLQRCMPSLLSYPQLGIPAFERALAAGWVIVATDYAFAEKGGPHPYLIGEGEARSVLDSLRAAQKMPDLVLDPRTVVWGHSQGGHAALWTAIVAPRYAPEVKLAGIFAVSPAADMRAILKYAPDDDKYLGPWLVRAYSRFYAGIKFEDSIRPQAMRAAEKMINACLFAPPGEAMRFAALAASFEGPSLAQKGKPALLRRLVENVPLQPVGPPLAIAQGLADDIVPARATELYVKGRCAAGQSLDYMTWRDLDHIGIVLEGSALEDTIIAWTQARFAGEAVAKGCRRKRM